MTNEEIVLRIHNDLAYLSQGLNDIVRMEFAILRALGVKDDELYQYSKDTIALLEEQTAGDVEKIKEMAKEEAKKNG